MADDVMQRVREGSGPDRELDMAIHPLVVPDAWQKRYDEAIKLGEIIRPDEPVEDRERAARRHAEDFSLCPAYTASVDPWLALARERGWFLQLNTAGHAFVVVDANTMDVAEGNHTDPARACALAMLEALGHE